MAMNEKQIYRRMNEAFEAEFSKYEYEAAWWGNDDLHIWVFTLPSLGIDIKMELNEEVKQVRFYVRDTIPNKRNYSYVDNANWKSRQSWSW